MPTDILRPNADVVNAWTKSAGTTSFGALDDAVTDPTNARTAGDGVHITSSTAAQESEVDVGTFALPAGNVVSQVRAKVFAAGGNRRGANVRLLTGATQLVAATAAPPAVSPAQAEQWYTLTFNGPLTQAEIDALRIEIICTQISGGGATAATVYAAYIEVDHAPDVQNKAGSDTAAGSETAAAARSSSAAGDTSTATDASAIAAAASSAGETAAAADQAAIATLEDKAGSDTAAGAETAAALERTAGDQAAGSETAAAARTSTGSDAAGAAESSALDQTEVRAGTDTAIAAEAATVLVAVSSADTAAAGEALELGRASSDTAAGAESSAYTLDIVAGDQAAGAEILAAHQALLEAADQAPGLEAALRAVAGLVTPGPPAHSHAGPAARRVNVAPAYRA